MVGNEDICCECPSSAPPKHRWWAYFWCWAVASMVGWSWRNLHRVASSFQRMFQGAIDHWSTQGKSLSTTFGCPSSGCFTSLFEFLFLFFFCLSFTSFTLFTLGSHDSYQDLNKSLCYTHAGRVLRFGEIWEEHFTLVVVHFDPKVTFLVDSLFKYSRLSFNHIWTHIWISTKVTWILLGFLGFLGFLQDES